MGGSPTYSTYDSIREHASKKRLQKHRHNHFPTAPRQAWLYNYYCADIPVRPESG